ncbi:MAG: hypothetical protein ABIO40_05305 [Devosia sp.]
MAVFMHESEVPPLARGRQRVPSGRMLATAAMLVLGLSFGAPAASAETVPAGLSIVNVEGTALQLVNAAWVEIAPGDPLQSLEGVRTLGKARLTIAWRDAVLEIGPETTIALAVQRPFGRTSLLVTQYAGLVEISVPDSGATSIVVRTPSFDISSGGGRFSVSVSPGHTEAKMIAGSAVTLDHASGKSLKMEAGTIGQRGTSPGNKGNGPGDNNGNGGQNNNGGNGGNGGENNNGGNGGQNNNGGNGGQNNGHGNGGQ